MSASKKVGFTVSSKNVNRSSIFKDYDIPGGVTFRVVNKSALDAALARTEPDVRRVVKKIRSDAHQGRSTK